MIIVKGGLYEDAQINPQNPYGKTKFAVENILDLSKRIKILGK